MTLSVLDMVLSVLGLAMLALAWGLDWLRPGSFARLEARAASPGAQAVAGVGRSGAETARIGMGAWLAGAAVVFVAMVLGGALAFAMMGPEAMAQAGRAAGAGAMPRLDVSLEDLALLNCVSFLLPGACAIAAVEMLRRRWAAARRAADDAGVVTSPALPFGAAGLAWGLDGRGVRSAAIGTLVVVPVCGLTGVLSTLVYTAIYGERPGPIAHNTLDAFVDGLADPSGRLWVAVLAVVLVTLVPLTEDVFFRVCVQSGMVAATGGRGAGSKARRWTPIFIASALFTGMHVSVAETRVVDAHALPVILVLSIGLGIAYERTGRVMVPVMMHGAYNALNLVAATFLISSG